MVNIKKKILNVIISCGKQIYGFIFGTYAAKHHKRQVLERMKKFCFLKRCEERLLNEVNIKQTCKKAGSWLVAGMAEEVTVRQRKELMQKPWEATHMKVKK